MGQVERASRPLAEGWPEAGSQSGRASTEGAPFRQHHLKFCLCEGPKVARAKLGGPGEKFAQDTAEEIAFSRLADDAQTHPNERRPIIRPPHWIILMPN